MRNRIIALLAICCLQVTAANSRCDNTTQFACGRTAQCIPLEWRCDGVPDCFDKTDETGCSYMYPCPKGEYNCHDHGECVQSIFKCNGVRDCHDGRDEWACSDHSDLKPDGAGRPSSNCGPDLFACKGPAGGCIHLSLVCDGVKDCQENDDESECHSHETCPPNQWKCKDDACIPKQWVCDGEPDCTDDSDEDACDVPEEARTPSIPASNSSEPAPAVNTTCRLDQYRCKGASKCIDVGATCNGVEDCPDGDDERGKCGECETMGCTGGCHETALEARCTCPADQISDPSDFRLCIKDNPCLHHQRCYHFCRPTETGIRYQCTCAPGFTLGDDMHQCTPVNDPKGGELMISLGNEIRVGALHDQIDHPSLYRVYSALDNGDNVYHMAMDLAKQHLWFGIGGHTDQWRLARTTNGQPQAVRQGFEELRSIEYDWINRNVYFINGGVREDPKITVCTDDALYCTKLVTSTRHAFDGRGRRKPTVFKGLALHPTRGLMCWIEQFKSFKVKCANTDGSEIHTLLDEKLADPRSLVWDTIRNDLYIADNGNEMIERINYDTKERQIIATRTDSIYAMAFFNGILYYSETEMDVVRSIDVSSDHHMLPHTERLLSRPFGLAVNHTLAQYNPGWASCHSEIECQYVCVKIPKEGTFQNECLCPEGYRRNSQDGCEFPANATEYKTHSSLEVEYMKELCERGKACGFNGNCDFTMDSVTGELLSGTCRCDSGYTGAHCEIFDEAAMAIVRPDDDSTSFLTVLLLVLAFIVILAVCFYCIQEKHQPFKNFADGRNIGQSTGACFVSITDLLRGILPGTAKDKAPDAFSSPFFEATEAPRSPSPTVLSPPILRNEKLVDEEMMQSESLLTQDGFSSVYLASV